MALLKVLGLSPSPAVARNASAGEHAGGSGAGGNAKTEKLSKAAEGWRQIHRQADERIAALKAAIKGHYADGHPELIQAVEQGLLKLDEVLDNVDHRLADSLAHAGNAPDDRARDAELKNAKAILAEYIGYMKAEPLIAHIDQNPWKVKIDLKALLIGGLTGAAKAIG